MDRTKDFYSLDLGSTPGGGTTLHKVKALHGVGNM